MLTTSRRLASMSSFLAVSASWWARVMISRVRRSSAAAFVSLFEGAVERPLVKIDAA